MIYELCYSIKAAKFISKLPKEQKKRVLSVIERSRIRPGAHFERLVGDKSYKLRAGDYRIIADIFNDVLLILVVKAEHRKKVYKKS